MQKKAMEKKYLGKHLEKSGEAMQCRLFCRLASREAGGAFCARTSQEGCIRRPGGRGSRTRRRGRGKHGLLALRGGVAGHLLLRAVPCRDRPLPRAGLPALPYLADRSGTRQDKGAGPAIMADPAPERGKGQEAGAARRSVCLPRPAGPAEPADPWRPAGLQARSWSSRCAWDRGASQRTSRPETRRSR